MNSKTTEIHVQYMFSITTARELGEYRSSSQWIQILPKFNGDFFVQRYIYK